ncbi:hypothetical protein R1flu_002543 [Riccia fluitans]|uniref:Uncharacterized protein n=1 Tax=Riccia fluitans TaxID=41844 RepID=A0ABD1Y6P1_9MARC
MVASKALKSRAKHTLGQNSACGSIPRFETRDLSTHVSRQVARCSNFEKFLCFSFHRHLKLDPCRRKTFFTELHRGASGAGSGKTLTPHLLRTLQSAGFGLHSSLRILPAFNRQLVRLLQLLE